MVAGMGIPVENLDIDVDGDLATIKGVAPTQADREKLILLVGNVNGIAKVDDQLTIAPEPAATFYTVVSGDTLSKIAKAHYDDPIYSFDLSPRNTPSDRKSHRQIFPPNFSNDGSGKSIF